MDDKPECGHRYVARHTTIGHDPSEFPERTWWQCQECPTRFKIDPWAGMVAETYESEPLELGGVIAHIIPTGWVCPLCTRVYAPHISECHRCSKSA